MRAIIGGVLLFTVACSIAATHGREMQISRKECEYWQSKVDPAVPLRGGRLHELPSDQLAVEAIRCLLAEKGRVTPARVGGVTRVDVSQIAPEASVEIAALYYVTFIYERAWDHGDAVMLVGPNGVNSTDDIRNAFQAMEDWVDVVETIGIAEVRARRIHPLAGTSLAWYGREPTSR